MDTIKIQGQLEIDQQRGVIYFHDGHGITRLRICQLPVTIPHPVMAAHGGMLDITHMHGASWVPDE